MESKALEAALRKEVRPLLLALRETLEEGSRGGLILRMEKGEGETVVLRGEDGKTPVLGVDYFTKKDVASIIKAATPSRDSYFTERDRAAIIKAATPKKGVDYKDGQRGLPGHTPRKGVDYFTEREVVAFLKAITPKKGVHYKDGEPGKVAPPLSAEDVRTMLESLKGTGRLKAKSIHGLDEMVQKAVSDAGSGPSYSMGGGDSGQGLSFPVQTNNVGRFLKTDGSSVSWGDLFPVVVHATAVGLTPNVDVEGGAVMVCDKVSGTFTFGAPTGTPKDMGLLLVRLKTTNVQTYAFNAIYRFSTDLAAPTASTGGGATDYLAFRYNATDTKYDYVGKLFGF